MHMPALFHLQRSSSRHGHHFHESGVEWGRCTCRSTSRSARNFLHRRIRTRAPFHGFPVRERCHPATDKGKITKPRKLPENDAKSVAFGVALPEKKRTGIGDRPIIHGNSRWLRSHFQVIFFLAIVYGPCGAHCTPDLTWGFWFLARSRGTNSSVRLWETAGVVYFRVRQSLFPHQNPSCFLLAWLVRCSFTSQSSWSKKRSVFWPEKKENCFW